MSSVSNASPLLNRSAPSLHYRFLVGAGIGGALVIVVLAIAANLLLGREISRQGDARLSDAAGRGLIVVSGALIDRTRQAKVLALSPEIESAARDGGSRARALGIAGLPIPTLESQFKEERSLLIAPATRVFLRELLPELEAAEILLTDANGYNAITTELTSDFVQSDEAWWQSAWRVGMSAADAAYDSSARQTTLSLAAVVKSGAVNLGVLKLAFSAVPLVASLASAGAGVHIDIVDSTDRVLLSSDSMAVGRRLRGLSGAKSETARAVSVTLDSVPTLAATRRTNSDRWRVVAHLPTAEIAAPFRKTRLAIGGAAAALLVVLILLLTALNGFLHQRITTPAKELADAAEAVAAGDFSVDLRHSSVDDEIGRLSRAVGAMILELRRLTQAISGAARETNAMSMEITAGSQEVAATAGEIARTASDLSFQASTMAEAIASLAAAATALQSLAVTMDEGARSGVSRNMSLRRLALANRAGLDASASSLGALAQDVQASNTAIVELGTASEEIRSFVKLVRSLARQSKMLALNAALEAARAGEHGQGFAVVASEVRRLAAMSSSAADQTEKTVRAVLEGIELSRDSADRAVARADEVRAATSTASASFAEIESAVAHSEAWTTTIAGASTATNTLVVEITGRLQSLSGGTDSFAAAMQQVAASSQEQSASTDQIAAAASTLASAAEKLQTLVSGLKVGAEAVEPVVAIRM